MSLTIAPSSAVPAAGGRRGRDRSRLQRLAGLAVAVAVVALVRSPWPLTRSPTLPPPELETLFAALARGATRPVEGRLALGFPHRAVRAETRGPRRGASPEVQIAAALIEKRAGVDGSPAITAALAAAHIALGDWDKAVAAMEDASTAAPDTASFENDRAVAYMGRAAALDRAEDWVTALAAANRAIELDGDQVEAYFNRALALRGLHLTSEEVEAWLAFQRLESAGPWFEESARRLETLRRRSRPQPGDPGAWDHQWVRERIEDRLLPEWGAAVERGDQAAATTALTEAGRLAAQLAASGGDRMAHEEIERIAGLVAQRSAVVAVLAEGYLLYGSARKLWEESLWSKADDQMRAAAVHLRRGGSPYAPWADVLHAIVLQRLGKDDDALSLIQSVTPPSPDARHYHLRGRRAWVEGVFWAVRSRFEVARSHYEQAISEFTAAGEYDYLASLYSILAEADSFLGERSNAWTHLVSALEMLDRRESTRSDPFDVAGGAADDEGLPGAALEFRTAMVRVARTPYLQSQGYLRRARTLARLNRPTEGAEDLARAEAAFARIVDEGLARRTRADLRVARAEVAGKVDCADATTRATEALEMLSGPGTIRRGAMFALRAECQAALGNRAGAYADFEQAIAIFEARRTPLVGAGERAQAFTMERTAYRRLLQLTLADKDVDAAFAIAERARSGILAGAWPTGGQPSLDEHRLPADVGVVYYEVLPDRVMTWVMTRHGRSYRDHAISDAQVRRWVVDMRRAIDRGADVPALQPHSRPLFEALIAPALEAVERLGGAETSTIVFVPDGPLFGVPFAAIPDRQGRPLLETRVITTAPSLAALLLASEQLQAFAPHGVLAIGDGHDPETSGLPRLQRADDEAVAVARLYPEATILTGAAATRRRLMERQFSVLHFAGHSVLDERDPLRSRLLLAPDRSSGETAWLLHADITRDRFGDTGVVVLATCEGAAGRPVEGDGAISLARAFFAAGVPAVVASLWPVDDNLQTLMLEFHRTLRRTRNPVQALRSGQRALLAERGLTIPVRVWGGFITLGGLGPSASN